MESPEEALAINLLTSMFSYKPSPLKGKQEASRPTHTENIRHSTVEQLSPKATNDKTKFNQKVVTTSSSNTRCNCSCKHNINIGNNQNSFPLGRSTVISGGNDIENQRIIQSKEPYVYVLMPARYFYSGVNLPKVQSNHALPCYLTDPRQQPMSGNFNTSSPHGGKAILQQPCHTSHKNLNISSKPDANNTLHGEKTPFAPSKLFHCSCRLNANPSLEGSKEAVQKGGSIVSDTPPVFPLSANKGNIDTQPLSKDDGSSTDFEAFLKNQALSIKNDEVECISIDTETQGENSLDLSPSLSAILLKSLDGTTSSIETPNSPVGSAVKNFLGTLPENGKEMTSRKRPFWEAGQKRRYKRKVGGCQYCTDAGVKEGCGLYASKCPNRLCSLCNTRHRYKRCMLFKNSKPIPIRSIPAEI